MNKVYRNKKGLTLVELLVAASISVLVIGVILMTWIFTYQTWKTEGSRTYLRVNLLQGLETVKEDIRLSSATFISFFPAGSEIKTAVSLPRADVDANGYYVLNAFGEIVWDRTIIYHIYTPEGDEKQLRRTVISPRDNTMDHDERYAQLVQVVTDGDGGDLGLDPAPSTEILLKDLDTFEITPLPAIFEFYQPTGGPVVRMGKVVFGWERLGPGNHTIRFEAIGKHPDSLNYRIGVDYIKIEPSGSQREAEYYISPFAPSGAFNSSGDTVVTADKLIMSNDNFLKLRGNEAGDFFEITDYYDLWRESVFDNCTLDNVTDWDVEVRMKLELPEDRDTGQEEIVWQAHYQTGDSDTGGRNALVADYPQAVRVIISNAYIDAGGDMVRVQFMSSVNPFKISAAYITRRNGTSGEDGLANQATGALDISEYHRHQQLFFRDEYDMDGDLDTEDMVEYLYIPAGKEQRWSDWTEFPLILEDLGGDIDYFITFCVQDPLTVTWPTGWVYDSALNNTRFWLDPAAKDHTYYINTGTYADMLQAAGTPVWSTEPYVVNTSEAIPAVMALDVWTKAGTLESDIFDTRKDDPVYNEVKWSEDAPTGTEVRMKVRSSDDQFMTDASEWDLITGSTANPASLSIGTGRYLQFFAEFSAETFWTCPTLTLTNADYVDTQLGLGADHLFPQDSGEYLVTGVYSTWIDDVEMDWPGDERICVISGYIARDTNCARCKVFVDGREVVKTLDVYIKFTTDVQERTVTEEGSVQVEPRNTGR